MRKLGRPWFDRAETISIGSHPLKAFKNLKSLKYLQQVNITSPCKARAAYLEIREHYDGHPRLDVYWHNLRVSRVGQKAYRQHSASN